MFCFHRRATTPRHDDKGSYIACLDCAARLPWQWNDRRVLNPPRLTAPRKEKGVIIELDGIDRMLLEEAGKSDG